LQGDPPGHGFHRNELLLSRACGLNNFAKLVVNITNYMFESSFTNHLPHLEGKEFFGFAK
jgi:hypothetical protein